MLLSEILLAAAVAILTPYCGAASSGVEFGVQPQILQVTLHEPVLAQMTITNKMLNPVRLDLGPDFKTEYRVAVTGPDGLRKDVPRLPREESHRLARSSSAPGSPTRVRCC